MKPPINEDQVFTTEGAAEMLGIRPGLLNEWRYLDKKDGLRRGPRPFWVGRLVRYRLSEIEAWLERSQPES